MLNLTYLLSLTGESDYSKVMSLYAFHDSLIKFAKRRLRQAGQPNYEYDAQDAVQSSYENMIRYIDSIDFSVSAQQLKAYAFSVAVNEINAILRERKYLENIDDYEYLAEDIDIIDQIQAQEDYNKVLNVIKGMDEKYSMIIFCRYIRDMDVKEIAEQMDLPLKTVYTRLRRGKQILHNILNDTDKDDK